MTNKKSQGGNIATEKSDINKTLTNRSKLKKLINNSPVFGIDREKNPDDFKEYSKQLVEYLYLYIIESYRKNRDLLFDGNYAEYGLEIAEIGFRCIKNYDANNENGASFLTYFINAWEKECMRIRGDIAITNRLSTLSISERDKRLLKKLQKHLKISGMAFLPCVMDLEQVADALDVSTDKAQDIINLHLMTTVSIVEDENGEEISILDTIPNNTLSGETMIINRQSWEALMKMIDNAVKSFSKKPEQYILDMLTCDVAEALLITNECYSCEYSFINKDLLINILSTGLIPMKKDIAQKYKKSPQAIGMGYLRALNHICEYKEREDSIYQK